MEIKYLMQPQQNLGSRLTELFQQSPPAREIRIVSAFMNLTTLLRFKTCLEQLSIQQCDIRITVGIDMGGTSVEVLNELSSWSFVETYIYHNAYPGHTFHPKVILVEYSQQAHLFVGSNNFTEGGFFSNYEASTEIIFDLDHDHENYSQAKAAYRIFFEPTPPLGQRLTQELLRTLSIRNDVLSEVIIRQKRICGTMNNVINLPSSPFGVEKIQRPPRLIPLNQQEPRNTSSQFFTDENFPIHFYMMLPKLQGATIPGEARIPLAALNIARPFWGYPEKYTRKQSPRSGIDRIYYEWHPTWEIIWWEYGKQRSSRQAVRMYMYENSSDFRFYARPLVNAGGDVGDIVRISHSSENNGIDFQCILALKNTPLHSQWIALCTDRIRNTERLWGYEYPSLF